MIQWQGRATEAISRTVSTLVQGPQMLPRFSQDVATLVTSTPLAVTLASFDAQSQDSAVLVTWETVSEIDNAGFNLYRTDAAGNSPEPGDLLVFVPSAAPGSGQGSRCQWIDPAIEPSTAVFYWLESVDLNGDTDLHGPVRVDMQAPTSVRLMQFDAASQRLPIGMPTGAVMVAITSAWLIRRRLVRKV